MAFKQAPAVGIQRQMGGQAAQNTQIDHVEADIAGNCGRPGNLPQIDKEIGRCHTHAVVGQQFNLVAGHRPAVRRITPLQPPAHAGQIQFRHLAPEADLHRLQRQIGGQAPLAVAEIAPDPQGAPSLRQLHRVIDPGPPAGEIGVIEFDEQFARQMRQRVVEIAMHFAANIDMGRQRRRRRGRNTKTVPPAAIVEGQLQVFQHQWRRLPQAIIPDHHRVADANPPLLQHPARECRIALALRRDAGDGDPPVLATTDMQYRTFEIQQRQQRPPAQHRLPGEHTLDPSQ